MNTSVVTLKIENSQPHDVGQYLCLAENEVGKDQTHCSVLIIQVAGIDQTPLVNPDAFRYLEQHQPQKRQDEDGDPKIPPKVVIPLHDVKQEEGKSVYLPCKITGLPRPKLTWFKDGKLLPASNRYKSDYDFNTSVASLKIKNIQVNDVGSYAVVAENEVGRDETHCSVLIIQVSGIDQTPLVNPDAFRYLEQHAPRKSRNDDDEPMIPPKVIVPLVNVKLNEGQPVVLACKIQGYPKPNVIYNVVFFSSFFMLN